MKRGRPPGAYKGGAGVHLGVQFNLYMTEDQRLKLGLLARAQSSTAAAWIRAAIDAADMPKQQVRPDAP